MPKLPRTRARVLNLDPWEAPNRVPLEILKDGAVHEFDANFVCRDAILLFLWKPLIAVAE